MNMIKRLKIKRVYCPECDAEKQSPWFDEQTGLWVHTQRRSGMIVICNKLNPDLDDSNPSFIEDTVFVKEEEDVLIQD